MDRRVGVNYTPTKNWWWCWQEWDEDAIRRDLDAVAELGCDHTRIFPLWNLFQPDASWISQLSLARLLRMLDLHAERGLQSCITLLNGWLSGMDFTPAWLWDAGAWRRRPLFTDPWVRDRTHHYVRTVVATTHDHPATLCYDVGNEPNVLTTWNPPATDSEPQEWADGIVDVVHETAPRADAVIGVAHSPWMETGSGFERHAVARHWRAPLHAWTQFTGALERFGENALETTSIADFLAEVAVASQPDGRRPVWIQEIGTSDAWVRAMSPADMTRALCEGITRSPSIDMVTWWCSHDLDSGLSSFHPMEYSMGLIGHDNRIKPTGDAFRTWAEGWRCSSPEPRNTALVIDGPVADLPHLQAWGVAARRGVWCALVDSERADDEVYLRGRGIERLVRLTDLGGPAS